MADAGQILVNFGTIEGAGSEVRTTAATIKKQLDDLRTQVKRIADSWTGVAQEGYQARQNVWDAKAADLHSTLLQIATALDNAHANYTHTESSNVAIWHQQ
ncbi:early secretory antigenic target protein ESAT-6 [Kitasatospora sp. MAP12-15]|uniref:WXG100 family type VII secretion target n=1 Tax=unclassified Kitasatospora TaxID=2633591 RepID=UPI002476F041|nr:WXG100 family type VII secretion target [Kitasatospora sp. MAP12-44]MDH6113188.1 early secretory antigenic target protein ESAT-6 [Kitasatospora sp. MAP12-44]